MRTHSTPIKSSGAQARAAGEGVAVTNLLQHLLLIC